jgi:ribose transport system ATP-binding protein
VSVGVGRTTAHALDGEVRIMSVPVEGEAPSIAAGAPMEPVLQVIGLDKAFAGQQAVDNLSLNLVPGQIRALVGKNGCGKSTLIKILAGYHLPDGGEVLVGSSRLVFGAAESAESAGLRFVHQDLGLVATLDTVDNLALGHGYHNVRAGRIQWRKERARARKALAALGYDLDVTVPVGKLTMSERTAVAIARAVADRSSSPRVLVLDEPTANMPAPEVARLFELVRTVRASGVAVLYVSHHLHEVFELAESVTVMRDGKHVITRPIAGLSEDELVQLMIGRQLAAADARLSSRTTGETLLSVTNLTASVLNGVSFDVRGGEIVGVCGITGSGREQLPMAIFGGIARGGVVKVAGRTVPQQRPDLAVAAGVGFIPSDRHVNAAILEAPIRENVTVVNPSTAMLHGVLRKGRERADVSVWLDRLSVKPPNPDMTMAALSGGNQQKVILARWLRQSSRVLILDEPTQGVDVGAKADIHTIIADLAAKGAGILLASSDEEELATLCDRVIVFANGRIARILTGPNLAADDISAATLGADSISAARTQLGV